MTPVVNHPSATTAVISDKYISTFDIHKPSIRNELFKRFGKQGVGFFATIETLGFVEPVDQTNWSHYEEDFYHETFTVNTSVANPGAGNSVNIRLQASNVDGSGYFYVRINDDVLIPNQVTGKVIAIDTTSFPTPQITVEPHSSADNIGPLAAGQEISIYSNGWQEDTDQPDGRVAKVSKFTFGAKIIKETVITTGTEMTNGTWFDKDSDGNAIGAYYLTGQLQADYRMMLQIDGASLFDRPITNPTLVNAGHRNMTGLVPWMRGNAPIGGYTPGLFSMSNINYMIKRLEKNFAADEYLWMNGIDLSIEIEDLCADYFEENPIIFAGDGGGKTAKELNLGFKTINKSEYTFHLQKMKVFSNPKVYNIAGYNITGLGIVAPLGYRQDPQTKKQVPSLGMRYKEKNGYSRKMEFFVHQGAGNGQKQITRDRRSINMRTEMGTEFFGGNSFFLWEEV